jgi:hypothetical protein
MYGPTYRIVDIGIFMEYITTHVVGVRVTRPPRVNVIL